MDKFRIFLNASQPFVRIIPMPRGASTRFGFRRLRRPLGALQLYGGRQMLNINRRALSRIFAFLERHPEWISYQRRVLIPDELFFNTILANDSSLSVANDVLRYIKWPKKHAASVAVIEAGEIDDVLRHPAPFALKLDCHADLEALEKIDAWLGIDGGDARINYNTCTLVASGVENGNASV